jgi:signal transduction histidine kinase
VADDTDDIRSLLRVVLTRSGFDVVGEAATGQEAVALVRSEQPDVVLIDLAMRVMGGLEAIPVIRREAPAVKIVVLSGFEREQKEDAALSAGADAYIEKGASPGALVSVINDVLARPVGAGPERTEPVIPELVNNDLSHIVHELMSPLTVIEGFASMLETRASELRGDEVADYAQRISRHARRLRSQIEAVADARRIDLEALVVEPQAVDVRELIAEAVADLAGALEPHPVVLDVARGLLVSADPPRVRQVLANLLSNAATFSPSSAPIEVSAAPVPSETAAGGVAISVVDHGSGVPVDRRAELFRRFSRLDAQIPGLGIGLYISHGIAEAHGGTLVIAPARPGEGARFVLTLPGA